MKTYQLALFASLKPSPPCFVIPVFTTKTSNGTFAQDLLPGGSVREFMTFAPEDFTIVNGIAPAIDVRVGEKGVVAFWTEEGEVICAVAKELQCILRTTDPLTSAPFSEAERSTFLEDSALLLNSATVAAQLIVNESLREGYHARLKDHVKILRGLRKSEEEAAKFEERSLDDLIRLLESERGSVKWADLWRNGWRAFKQNKRLIDAVRWKIMTEGLDQEEFSLLSDMQYVNDKGVKELFTWWLNNRSVKAPGWIFVWDMSIKDTASFPDEIIVDALENAFNRRPFIRHQWSMMNVWNSCFRYFPSEKRRITDIAIKNDGVGFYTEYFMEMIVLAIFSSDKNNSWARDHFVKWFSRVRGSSSWIRMLATFGEDVLPPDKFLDISIKWLRKFGAGTNRWIDLFMKIRSQITPDESWNIRISWLRRARKDLYTWPDVFQSLVDDAGEDDVVELSDIARSWKFKGREQRSDDTIADFATR